ncbi:MAG: response regulator transcription factor [Bacteroidetes bacterium]|nr:response regulator transcription factor [Bacteroidota bacterium]
MRFSYTALCLYSVLIHTDTITVFIADDHPVFRKGLRDIIEDERHLVFLGEAGNGSEALQAIEILRPRVAVLDLDMPGMTGLEIAQILSQKALPVALVFLTLYDDDAFFNRAMELGVSGYLLKDTVAADIVRCILAVSKGDVFISPTLSGRAVSRNGLFNAANDATVGLTRLTPTERRILRLIAEYKTSEQIALELFISAKTVENHRSNICHKLNLTGRNTLLRFASEHRSRL